MYVVYARGVTVLSRNIKGVIPPIIQKTEEVICPTFKKLKGVIAPPKKKKFRQSFARIKKNYIQAHVQGDPFGKQKWKLADYHI